MGALSDNRVGDYLNRHFVSAYQKVATFNVNGGQKQGGNVAGYFCTPDGKVLHAVAGPVSPELMLREARWAHETYQLAKLEKAEENELREFFKKAHTVRLQLGFNNRLDNMDCGIGMGGGGVNNQDQVHLLMVKKPLAEIKDVYRDVFEKILNEKISTEPVKVNGQ